MIKPPLQWPGSKMKMMYYWDEGDELWEHESTYYEEPPEDFFIAPEDDYPDWVDEDGVPHWGVDEE